MSADPIDDLILRASETIGSHESVGSARFIHELGDALQQLRAERDTLAAIVRAADTEHAAAIDVCQRAVDPSSGLIVADALNELIGIFDGPLQRAYDAARAKWEDNTTAEKSAKEK